MNIVIFGPPGAGKGTQSNLIVKNFNLYQLSTGELLRKEIKNDTKLGKEISSIINNGSLVSNKVVGDLIEQYLSNKSYKNRLIFDGYPRNLIQAKNLDYLLKKYEKSTEPVIDYYKKLNLLKVIDGERSIDQINKEISDIIGLI